MAIDYLRKQIHRKQLLIGILVVAFTIGVTVGLVLDATWRGYTRREYMYVRYPGDLAEAVMSIVEAPFIMAVLISATGTTSSKLLRRILFLTASLNMGLSFVAAWVGILVTIIIRPGVKLNVAPIGASQLLPPSSRDVYEEPILVQDSFMDVLRAFVPNNLMRAGIMREKTRLRRPISNTTVFSEIPWTTYEVGMTESDGKNKFGLAVISIAIGIAVKHLGPYGRPILAFSHSFADTTYQMAAWAAWAMPLVALFEVMGSLIEHDQVVYNTFVSKYCVISMYVSVAIQTAVILPLTYFAFTRQLPRKLLLSTTPSLLLAFCTGSRDYSYPTALEALEESGVNPRISRIVFSVSIFYNLNGSLIYSSVCAIFVKQLQNESTTFFDCIAISVVTPIAVLDWARIPEGLDVGEVALVLPYINVPDIAQVTKTIPMGWIIYPIREFCTLFSCIIITGIVNHYVRLELEKLPYFESVLDDEIIRKRLQMWTGREKELEETLRSKLGGEVEASDDDGDGSQVEHSEDEEVTVEAPTSNEPASIQTENEVKRGSKDESEPPKGSSFVGSLKSKESKGSKKSQKSAAVKSDSGSKKDKQKSKGSAGASSSSAPAPGPNKSQDGGRGAEDVKTPPDKSAEDEKAKESRKISS